VLSDDDSCLGLRTHTQAQWTTEEHLATMFGEAFPEGLVIGCGFRTLELSNAEAVADFLPSIGPAHRLPFGAMVDPGQEYGNSLAGELVALKLAVRFDEMDEDFAGANSMLRDAVIAQGTFEGLTVAELIQEADNKIGGCFSWYSRNQLRNAIAMINFGYAGGVLANGYLECPDEEPQVEMVLVEPERQLDEVTTGSDTATVVTAYPNPFMDITTIVTTHVHERDRMTIDILSPDGVVLERIFEAVVEPGTETRTQWNATGRARGVYLYRVSTTQRMTMGRLVLQ
jgi:hypothetical protein